MQFITNPINTPRNSWRVLGTRQRREDMTSHGRNNWHTMITFQGQELSWTQGTEIALWTKSQQAHSVLYQAKAI